MYTNSFAKKTLKDIMCENSCVYIITRCDDLSDYDEMIKIGIAEKTSWNIVENLQDADWVLKVNSWSRPQVAGIVRDFYAIIELPNGSFIWRSDMKCGTPNAFNGYDCTKASIKMLINEVLKKDVAKVQNIISPEINLTGTNKVSSNLYQESQDYFFSAIDYYDSYKLNEALKAVKISIKKNPYNAYAHRLLAIIYYKKEKYNDVLDAVQEAMRIDPYNIYNDSLYLAAKLKKNERFMKRLEIANAAISSLNAISSVFANSINAKYSIQTKISTMKKNNDLSDCNVKREICSFCNGTGVSPTTTSTASFAESGEVWCDVCRKWVHSGHGYHDDCPSCGGRGWREKVGY